MDRSLGRGDPMMSQAKAAAIAAFCFGERAAILDGNVKRVLARALGFDGDLDLNIVIRTVICNHGRAYFQVGGGIVSVDGRLDGAAQVGAHQPVEIGALHRARRRQDAVRFDTAPPSAAELLPLQPELERVLQQLEQKL